VAELIVLAIGGGIALLAMLLGFFAVSTNTEPPRVPRGRRSPVPLSSRSRGPHAPTSPGVERVRPR
jgi:hypothetical protein